MKTICRGLLLALGVAVAISGRAETVAAAKLRDVCVEAPTGGGGFNVFVFRDVEPLTPGRAISLRGLYFATGPRRLAALDGSAVVAADGTVRLGFFVHSTAESTNDFTVAGITDTNFVGTVSFDSDGDFVPNGTLTMQTVDCATIDVP